MITKGEVFGICDGHPKDCDNIATNEIIEKCALFENDELKAKFCDSCLANLLIDSGVGVKNEKSKNNII